MTTDHQDATAELLRRAEEINKRRMQALEPLIEMVAKKQRLKKDLDALEVDYGRLYADCEREGWDRRQLSELGAEEPARRPRGRPAGRRPSPSRKSTPKAPGGADSSSATASEDSSVAHGGVPAPSSGEGREVATQG